MTKQKPLSYVATKIILQELSLEKRETIDRRIPALQMTNSLIPYKLKRLELTEQEITINDRRRYRFNPVFEKNEATGEKTVVPNASEVRILLRHSRRLNMSPDEAYKKLFDSYFHRGAIVREAVEILDDQPSFFMNREKSDFKIQSKNLVLWTDKTEVFDKCVQFVDMDKVEHFMFLVFRDNEKLLDRSEITKIKRLSLDICSSENSITVIKTVLKLKNEILDINYTAFRIDNLQKLVEGVIASDRKVGSRILLGQKTFERIMDIFDHFKNHMGAVPSKHPRLGQSLFANGVTLKMMGHTRELVMFGNVNKENDPSLPVIDSPWKLEMEVMERGASTNADVKSVANVGN